MTPIQCHIMTQGNAEAALHIAGKEITLSARDAMRIAHCLHEAVAEQISEEQFDALGLAVQAAEDYAPFTLENQPPVEPEAPAPAPLAWAVQMKGIPDIWSTFPAEKYARQQLQQGLKSGRLGGYESDWEIFPIYRASPMGLDPDKNKIIEAEKRGFIWGYTEGDIQALNPEDAISRAEEKWETLYANDPHKRWTKTSKQAGEGSPPDTAPAGKCREALEAWLKADIATESSDTIIDDEAARVLHQTAAKLRDEALATPDPVRVALTWTKEKPKVEGWYWTRLLPGEAEVVMIETHSVGEIMFTFTGKSRNITDTNPEREWAGPIPEPKEIPQ